jgi:hypothetical protein
MLQIKHYNQQYLTEIFFFILFKPLKCETSNFKSPFWFNNLVKDFSNHDILYTQWSKFKNFYIF